MWLWANGFSRPLFFTYERRKLTPISWDCLVIEGGTYMECPVYCSAPNKWECVINGQFFFWWHTQERNQFCSNKGALFWNTISFHHLLFTSPHVEILLFYRKESYPMKHTRSYFPMCLNEPQNSPCPLLQAERFLSYSLEPICLLTHRGLEVTSGQEAPGLWHYQICVFSAPWCCANTH